MKSKIKIIDECSALFEIEASRETIERAFDEVYDEITKIANIPGFRAGKAPKNMVKINYAKTAKEEVLKRLVPESYRKALIEHEIDPIGMPEISDLVFDDGKPLTFKAKIEMRPKFSVKSYKGLRAVREKVSITNDDIDNALKNLQQINAKYVSVADRPVQMGDYVIGDLECFMGGKAVHKKRENLWLAVEKESFIPRLSEKLIGLNRFAKVDIEADLPNEYPDPKLAGKAVTYHLLIKEIKKRDLPNIDDEFAKDLGKASLAELKAEVAKDLETRAKAAAEINVEKELLGTLIDDNVFHVPASFTAKQLNYMVDDAKRRLMEKGFNKEELDKKDKEFRDKHKDDAEKRIRLLFILDQIADKERITVTDEDMDEAFRSIAAGSGRTEGAVRDYYKKEGLLDHLRDKLRERKTIKFILDNSEITEK